jgi:hypothetical protein
MTTAHRNAEWRLVLTGKILGDAPPDEVVANLAAMLGLRVDLARKLMGQPGRVIKQGLSLKQALAIQKKIEATGAQCAVAPMDTPAGSETPPPPAGPPPAIPPTTECPKCHHPFSPPTGGVSDSTTCPACGVVITKFLRRQAQQALAPPSRRPASGRSSMLSGAADLLPLGILKSLKWVVTAVGVLMLLTTGISVFEMPSYGILYELEETDVICSDTQRARKRHPELFAYMAEWGMPSACLKSYRLNMINSAMRAQPQTVVRLRYTEAMRKSLLMKPVVLNYDRNPRDNIRVLLRDDTISYALGEMQSNDQVTLRMKLLTGENGALSWHDILESIEVARGEAEPGEASKFTAIMRLVFSLINLKDQAGNVMDTFLEDLREDAKAVDRDFQTYQADLALTIKVPDRSPPRSPHGEATHRVRLVVTNNGPLDDSDIRVHCSLPAGAALKEVSIGESNAKAPTMMEILNEQRRGRSAAVATLPPNCQMTSENAFSCRIANLIPLEWATLYVTMTGRGQAGALTLSADVSGSTRDDNQDNNHTAAVLPRR